MVRTRDTAKLADLNVVIDVGGVYDPGAHRPNAAATLHRACRLTVHGVAWGAAAKRFDHHQREFAEVFGHGARPSARVAANPN